MNSFKNISKLSLAIIGLIFTAQITYTQSSAVNRQSLTALQLDDFIALAQTNALSAEAAKADLNLAQLNFQIFKSTLKPNLTAMANIPNFSNTFTEVIQDNGTVAFQQVTNNNSTVGLQLSQNVGLTGGQVFATSNLQRFDDFDANKKFYNGTPIRVGFLQPLFGFNQVKWDKRIEPMRLEESEKKYAIDLEKVKSEAAGLFFDLLVEYENLKIAQSNKTSNETLFSIAEEKYKLGKISESDLLALQLELVSAKAEQQQATQTVRSASARIYTFLGREFDGTLIEPKMPEGELLLSTSLEHGVRDSTAGRLNEAENKGMKMSPKAAIEKANRNRPELISYARALTEAERDIAEAKGNGGFRADLSASFGLSRGSEQLEDIYGDPKPQQFIELQLSIPILDWRRQKSTVGIARVRRDFLQKSVERERLQFNAEIEQTVVEFNSLRTELELAEEVRDLARRRFEITSQSFTLGAISITDLTLAQREKDRSLRSYVFTLGRYWRSYFTLRALTGV